MYACTRIYEKAVFKSVPVFSKYHLALNLICIINVVCAVLKFGFLLTGYSGPRAIVWRATKSFRRSKWLCERRVLCTTWNASPVNSAITGNLDLKSFKESPTYHEKHKVNFLRDCPNDLQCFKRFHSSCLFFFYSTTTTKSLYLEQMYRLPLYVRNF